MKIFQYIIDVTKNTNIYQEIFQNLFLKQINMNSTLTQKSMEKVKFSCKRWILKIAVWVKRIRCSIKYCDSKKIIK